MALEHAALHLATDHRRLDEHPVILVEGGVERGVQVVPRRDLRHPDARPGTRRLHEDGEVEAADPTQPEVSIRRQIGPAHRYPGGNSDPRTLEHGLGEVFVHAERRREHAVAHVRQADQLERALDGAVLAERPVQDRERHVDFAQALHRAVGCCDGELAGRRRLRQVHASAVVGHVGEFGRLVAEREARHDVIVLQRPGAVVRDPDRDDLVARAIDGAEHPAGRCATDRVLARSATEEQRNADHGCSWR